MELSSLPRASGRKNALRPSRRLLAPLSDERLVEHVRRGSDAAFEVIYDRHQRGIGSFCRHMLASREEAEDAVQHTFLSAYRDLVESGKPIRLKAWLYTIARNRCLSMLRARREDTAELPDIPTAGLSDAVLQRDDLRRLLADVRSLPDDQRAALVLSELGDLSHADVAEIVGCEPVKVRSLVFQARSSLIESRRASEIPCEEIREQLATLRGGALRRGPLRRHVRSCAGCSEFRHEIRRQRAMLALVLPVIPTAGLKQTVLASAGLGSGATTGAAGGVAAGGAVTAGGAGSAGGTSVACGIGSASSGGLISTVGAAGAAKLAVVAVVAVAGGAAVHQVATAKDDSRPAPAAVRGGQSAAGHSGAAGAKAGASALGAANASKGARGKSAGKAGHGQGASAAHGNGKAAKHGHGSGPHGHGGKSAAHYTDARASNGNAGAGGGQSTVSHGGGSSHSHHVEPPVTQVHGGSSGPKPPHPVPHGRQHAPGHGHSALP